MITKISDISFKNKRVFLRCDFNVPLSDNTIASDLRIREALQTIEFILSQHPKQLILSSHLGRPTSVDEQFSLKIILPLLKKYLKKSIYFHKDIISPIPLSHSIILLENLRFWPAEQTNDKSFANALKKHADIYINDAFGTAHRKDVSVYALPKLFSKKNKSFGFLIQKELKEINFHNPRPLISILGPAKIKDKLPLFKKVFASSNKVLLGGGVVFTFLKAQGYEVGKSLVELEMLPVAKELLKSHKDKIILPIDFIAMNPRHLPETISERKRFSKIVSACAIPKNLACFDIGPKTIELYKNILLDAKTVLWNGPLGYFEKHPFNTSTKEIAKAITKNNIHSIVCGGDTASALKQTPYKSKITHISTGGGASLYLLSGKKLPALLALEK